jgi:hypothetical protein
MPKRKGKRQKLHEHNFQSRLPPEDAKEVLRMASGNVAETEVVRELIGFALKHKRLMREGKDAALDAVRDAQKTVVGEGIEPLVNALNSTRELVEKSVGQMHDEYAQMSDRLGKLEAVSALLTDGFDRILQNQILIRALQFHYVFSFYYTVLASKDAQLTQEGLAELFRQRVRSIKVEAAKVRKLSDEASFERIVDLIGKELFSAAKSVKGSAQASHHVTGDGQNTPAR